MAPKARLRAQILSKLGNHLKEMSSTAEKLQLKIEGEGGQRTYF